MGISATTYIVIAVAGGLALTVSAIWIYRLARMLHKLGKCHQLLNGILENLERAKKGKTS